MVSQTPKHESKRNSASRILTPSTTFSLQGPGHRVLIVLLLRRTKIRNLKLRSTEDAQIAGALV